MLTQAMPSAKVYSKRNSTNKVYFLLTTVERIQHDMSIFRFNRAVMGVLLRMFFFQVLLSLPWGWKVSTHAALKNRTPEWQQLWHDCRVTREEEMCDISSKEMRNKINCRGKAINHSKDLESP